MQKAHINCGIKGDHFMIEPIFLKPCFQKRIWGGTKLKKLFQYPLPSSNIGECWAASTHPNGQSIVLNGVFQGLTLEELWRSKPELFNFRTKDNRFPLLVKILDASQDLSVQVHPDDRYASIHHPGESGKSECWFIIEAEPGSEIILGHNARSKNELIEKINNNQWDQLLNKIKVQAGDFFYIPSGTIHALGKGIVVYEAQQNSDVTYRLYDYDRTDSLGNKRELHVNRAVEVAVVPHQQFSLSPQTNNIDNTTIVTYLSGPYFMVQKWEVKGKSSMTGSQTFAICSVISGEGSIAKGRHVSVLRKGNHFIIPAEWGDYELHGNFSMIISVPMPH
jgi:mannose-6-phosphate isomerase